MTREDRARKMVQQVAEPAAGIERFRPVLTVQEAVEVALAFADAEAAAMRERAAVTAWTYGCEAYGMSGEVSAAEEIEARIRALPATGEVGR